MSPIRSFVKVENARIGMRNFSGRETEFNAAGKKNFCVFIGEEDAEALHADGWNVHWLEPRDPEGDRQAYLPVAISYDYYPPDIWIVTTHHKTKLREEDLKLLDWAEIEKVDITIRPYSWSKGGKSGIKAYVKVMYVTIVEDELSEKYRNVPDSATSVMDDERLG